MQQACFSAPVVLSFGATTFFVLRLPVRPFSGLLGEADYPPFPLLKLLSRLSSALIMFLEGDFTSYICSEISIRSNMAQVSL